MITLLYKAARKLLVFIITVMGVNSCLKAQDLSINGPVCILPGLTYQYNLTNKWIDSTVQVCVTGGHLISGERCTARSRKIVSVFVVWDSSGQRKLTVSLASGNVELSVQATVALNGGKLYEVDRVQQYDSSKTIYSFRCDTASGGACTPTYLYQWQQSIAGGRWTDIDGAKDKDLQYTAAIQVTVRLRRVTTDITANTVAYSGTGILHVRHRSPK
jgi:hypothetical protein